MEKCNCSLCLESMESDNAGILTMGGYGNPKYLCEKCAAHIDNVMKGRDVDSIKDSLEYITSTMSANNIDSRAVLNTVGRILKDGADRANKIKEGTYDFALDEAEDEGFDEIPEELRETEEDAELDRREAEFAKKFDKVLNWVWAVVLVGAVTVFLLKFVFHVI